MIKLWQRLAEETIVSEHGKELRIATFLNPNTDKKEEFFLIGLGDWSVVLPITEKGEVVTVRQYLQGCDKIAQELPGGNIDKGEKPEEAAIRELMEETGYQGKRVIPLGPPLWLTTRNSWTRFYPFLALECKKVGEGKLDPSEEIEVIAVPLKKWIEMIQAEIEAPDSVVTTFRALPYLDVYL